MRKLLLLLTLAGCYTSSSAEHDARQSGAGSEVRCVLLSQNGGRTTFACSDQFSQTFICTAADGCIRLSVGRVIP